MKTFILNLDKRTRDELYEEIAPDFLGFILIEAIFYTMQANSPFAKEDVEYNLDDPDSQFETSIEYLITLLEKFYGTSDTFSPEDLEFNSSVQDNITAKLHMAIDSINKANTWLELSVIGDVFRSPEFEKSFKFTTKHCGYKVVFTISTDTADPLASLSTNTYNLGILN